MANILVVDDEKNMRVSLRMVLEDGGHEVNTVKSAADAITEISKEDYDIVITDARMPGMSGYDLLEKVKKQKPNLIFIIITAYGTKDLILKAMKHGAYDYLTKPFNPEELLFIVKKAIDFKKLNQENANLIKSLANDQGAYRLIGQNKKIIEIKNLIRTVASTPSTVLVQGESGTGKELAARAIHYHSDRCNEKFISINCAALPENLLESELFGHERGSFTGAHQLRKGKFEIANRGTIFLDEIGDMSLPLQAKMLRVLQEKNFERIGGNKLIFSDVRIIAATNQSLDSLIQVNKFREDLYFRLNVINLKLPPLRERKDDIPILASYFIQHYNHLFKKNINVVADDVFVQLMEYDWPGNIRELQNVLERTVVIEETDVLKRVDFISTSRDSLEIENKPEMTDNAFKKLVEDYEAKLITSAMEKHDYKITKSAESLGLSRHSLRHHIARLFGGNVPWKNKK